MTRSRMVRIIVIPIIITLALVIAFVGFPATADTETNPSKLLSYQETQALMLKMKASIARAQILRAKWEATSTTSTTRPPKSRPVHVNLANFGERVDILNCIALHEGNPPYTNGLGIAKKYRGRYQFDQGSWNGVAKMLGRPELVGVDVASASPADQDFMAFGYFLHSGYGPWPPSQGKCPYLTPR